MAANTPMHRASLFKHIKKHHPNNGTSGGSIKCQEESCVFTCRYLDGLRSHLKTAHNFVMESEEMKFESMEGKCCASSLICSCHPGLDGRSLAWVPTFLFPCHVPKHTEVSILENTLHWVMNVGVYPHAILI